MSSVAIKTLVNYCDQLLDIEQFKDYCPNGLQVQGQTDISKIVSGVTASQALIDAAVAAKADLLLVHHGFFWKGESPTLIGMKYQRIKELIKHDINLVAYHLPLDAHPLLGNNARLAQALNLTIDSNFGHSNLGIAGSIAGTNAEITGNELSQLLEINLSRKPLHIPADKIIKRIGLCTGAAHGFINDAIENGVDAFISGEISESTVHIARENNIHYFAAGHHATERFGVQALGQHLTEHFELQHQFIDIDNPV